MIHQSGCGIATTRGSIRNSRRYRRTAAGVGASGVPRFTSRTPVGGATAQCCESAKETSLAVTSTIGITRS